MEALHESGQAGALEISEEAMEAGIVAFFTNYDREEQGLENVRSTVSAIVGAVLINDDHFVHLLGSATREPCGCDEL